MKRRSFLKLLVGTAAVLSLGLPPVPPPKPPKIRKWRFVAEVPREQYWQDYLGDRYAEAAIRASRQIARDIERRIFEGMAKDGRTAVGQRG